MNLGSTPVLAFTLADNVARLCLLFVPRALRGHGVGRRLFEQWEQSLPTQITEIELLPATIDETPPDGFWEHLGFVANDDTNAPESPCRYLHKARGIPRG